MVPQVPLKKIYQTVSDGTYFVGKVVYYVDSKAKFSVKTKVSTIIGTNVVLEPLEDEKPL